MICTLIDNFLLVKPAYLIQCTILVGGYMSYKYFPRVENNIRINLTKTFIKNNSKNYKIDIIDEKNIIKDNIKYYYKLKEPTFFELEKKYKNDLFSDKLTKEIIDFVIKDYLANNIITQKYIFINFKLYKSIFEIDDNKKNSNVLCFNLQTNFDDYIKDKVLLDYLTKNNFN